MYIIYSGKPKSVCHAIYLLTLMNFHMCYFGPELHLVSPSIRSIGSFLTSFNALLSFDNHIKYLTGICSFIAFVELHAKNIFSFPQSILINCCTSDATIYSFKKITQQGHIGTKLAELKQMINKLMFMLVWKTIFTNKDIFNMIHNQTSAYYTT